MVRNIKLKTNTEHMSFDFKYLVNILFIMKKVSWARPENFPI